jgi:tRNA threonylcarbamoyl adenosine modification protein (Sua5/YciO/YrdC/YwlC family)
MVESGHIIAYPTDTIYGLGAALDRRDAIEALYEIRGLDEKKPLSLVCSSLSEVSRYAIIDNDCHAVMRRALPGPYTFILKATSEAPRMGRSRRRTIGVRIPDSPIAMSLLEILERPLISTSAIIDDSVGPSDPIELSERLDPQRIGLVLDGGVLSGVPSTVVDWSEGAPVVLREGAGSLDLF